MLRKLTIPNPSTGELEPVTLLTDRAQRYRAQAAVEGPRKCIYCGGPATMVDHIDGHEEHGNPENLAHACRSCNVRKANVMYAAGLGRRTVQYNPSAPGARTLAQWCWAVARVQRRDPRTGKLLLRDHWKTTARKEEIRQAVELIRATPPTQRAEFAAELRSRRRATSRDASGDAPW